MSQKNGELLLLGQISEYSTKKSADLNIIHCRVDMLHSLPFTDPSVNTTLQHPLWNACLLIIPSFLTSWDKYYIAFTLLSVFSCKDGLTGFFLFFSEVGFNPGQHFKKAICSRTAVLRLGWVTKETLYCIIQAFFMPDCQVDVRCKGEYSEWWLISSFAPRLAAFDPLV